MSSALEIAVAARRFRLAVFVAIILLLGLQLIAVLGGGTGAVRVQSSLADQGVAGTILFELSVMLFVLALLRLAQMLGAIAEGPTFGERVTRAFRGFAFWLFTSTLVAVSAQPMLVLAKIIRSGGGHAALMFELREMLMLAGALFLFLLARMLERARAIETELEQIV